MWDWIPEEERRIMADVFAMENARNRRREEKPKEEPEPEPELSTSTKFCGAIFSPPGVYTNTTFDTTGNFKFK